ncbi:MIOREX complex component [Lachnellula suecica]|uniref:MIOREX complex component n=1 Tax=Lachnellula suecica TaxID=602035 RepID=A0A8T9C8K4_9HELO|nr:MIOREX complex component [Lachnellula suecica]
MIFAMQAFTRHFPSPIFRRVLSECPARLPLRHLHAAAVYQYPRKRNFFSSNAALNQEGAPATAQITKDGLPTPKRKPTRSPAGKASLRRVAAEAQRSRDAALRKKDIAQNVEGSNRVTAITVADEFDMDQVVKILRSHGFLIDPDETGFDSDQVVHTRGVNNGDIFVFPSGAVVAWSLPQDVVSDLAVKTLLPAAIEPHIEQIEMEDLEYTENDKRESSTIKGDVIALGTKPKSPDAEQNPRLDTTLVKIAFSSGLARSTNLGVLETMLGKYFESTKTIPKVLSRGKKLPFGRSFMLQKTGELLEIRAQLNHYSELTDSLPDLFWDSRHELGLEASYDQVGKALDVGVRIKTLNEKMDYAQEIASILRETMGEKHSHFLEWIIIYLIAVEILFTVLHEWRYYGERKTAEAEASKE